MKIHHNSWEKEYREPFGAAAVGSVVRVAVDIDCEAEVTLRLWHSEYGQSLIPMTLTDRFGEKNRYEAKFATPEEGCLIWYYFIVNDGKETVYYGNNDDKLGGEGRMSETEPESYQITVYRKTVVADWYKNGIAYQIFPDRFARDDDWKERCEKAISDRNAGMNPDSQEQFVEEDWSKPAYYIKDEENNVTAWPFYGGSFRGIIGKLDYLRSFGVSVIYLNPVFKAVSNHRYDTSDYMSVDPILGTEDEFRELIKEAKARGISIVLDGVFSHTGADSIYFDKYGNYGGLGAYNNEASKYRHWYKFDENEECGYKSWWGVKDLPEVDENNAFYRQMICGDGGVLKKWTKAGIRGWRLDVADELPDSFIRDIRTSIKTESRDNILLGEVWEDASNKESYGKRRNYLMGDELDSTMNYPLRLILLDYVNYTISSGEARRRIMHLKENYPRENLYAALNIMSSHDRERLLTLMAAEQDYDSASRKVKLLTTLQYTLPGLPCIYYGDEVGMTGGTDPSNRNAFPWGNENLDIAYHFRMLGLIYKEHPVLKNGEIELLSGKYQGMNDDVLAFVRYNKTEKILVVANRSYGDSEIDLSGLGLLRDKYVLDLLTSEVITEEKIHLDRLSSRVILIQNNAPETEGRMREAGVICHISSLPGGKLGKPARDFVDWICKSGMSIWQILPLNPNGLGDCPYNSYSAFAGNADFINYYELPDESGLEQFYKKNQFWLDDFVDYEIAMKFGEGEHDRKATITYRLQLIKEQYYFAEQWATVKEYANSKGVRIMGDLPMFVSAVSADVRGNREIFLMDEDGHLRVNAGVPPDDFSSEGQNWGSALYDWDALKAQGYRWWIERLKQCAERYDILRLDHFRAFSEYYAIPAGGTPKEGSWQNGPGMDFFRAVRNAFDENGLELEILAEDLGLLDAGVKNLLKLTGYPGMDIWQFSADEMQQASCEEASNRAYYTGTHDNQTLVGWLKSKYPDMTIGDIKEEARRAVEWIFKSSSKYAIVQLQDMFLLDDKARMNVPGFAEGNWKWKIPGSSIDDAFHDSNEVAEWYRNLIINSRR